MSQTSPDFPAQQLADKNAGKTISLAFILWFFLGVFGAHRFYLGRYISGACFVIFWLLVVGAFLTVSFSSLHWAIFLAGFMALWYLGDLIWLVIVLSSGPIGKKS